jgi:hypothetical protein
VQGDLAHSLAHPAQSHAQRRKRNARQREQEAGADRKSVGVIAGIVGPASGDESIRTAEGGRKDHERADRENEPWVTSRETTHTHLDPENPPHRQLP